MAPKLYAYLALLAVLGGGLWYVHHRGVVAGEANLASVEGQLEAELHCAAGSTCAQTKLKEALAGQQAVTAAQQEWQQKNHEQQAAQQRKTQVELDKTHQESLNAHRLLSSWQSKYDAALKNNQSCEAWAKEPILCPIE